MNKIPFTTMFTYSVFRFNRVFDLFEAKLVKVFIYFVLMNLIIFIPVTYQVATLDSINYSRFGMTFHEEVPEWFEELPKGCIISNGILDCQTKSVFEYDIQNRDTNYHIYFNVEEIGEYTESGTIIFGEKGFKINFATGNVLRFTYDQFPYTDFSEFDGMSKEEISTIIFDGMFQSMMPTFVLPIILFFVGGLMLMNFLLILFISALSMLFGFNQNDFPSYKNMIKFYNNLTID